MGPYAQQGVLGQNEPYVTTHFQQNLDSALSPGPDRDSETVQYALNGSLQVT
jgi:hypothetical protein